MAKIKNDSNEASKLKFVPPMSPKEADDPAEGPRSGNEGTDEAGQQKQGPSAVSSGRYKPGKPSSKMSQGGYGHEPSMTGSTTPQGKGKSKSKG